MIVHQRGTGIVRDFDTDPRSPRPSRTEDGVVDDSSKLLNCLARLSLEANASRSGQGNHVILNYRTWSNFIVRCRVIVLLKHEVDGESQRCRAGLRDNAPVFGIPYDVTLDDHEPLISESV